MDDLAIIILDWNGAEDTIECLESLSTCKYDIYLLDNGSDNDNLKKVRLFMQSYKNNKIVHETQVSDMNFRPGAINYILSRKNYGFAVGNNLISKAIYRNYKYLLLLNNDTIVPNGVIEHMLAMAEEKSTVLLTCDIRNYYNKNELWSAGGYFSIIGERRYYSQRIIDKYKKKGISYIDASFITGCAMLVKSSYIASNGLFTDRFFHGEEDFNLCFNINKKGDKIGVDLAVTIYHKVGRSINRKKDKLFNVMVINYLNRVIDFKYLYGSTKWKIWRCIYLFLIFIKRVIGGMNPRNAFLLCKKVRFYSDKYDNVKKPVFDMIMGQSGIR